MKVFRDVRPGDNLWWVSEGHKSVTRVTVDKIEYPNLGYKSLILREMIDQGNRRSRRIDISSRYLDKPHLLAYTKDHLYSDPEILLGELQERENKLLDELEEEYARKIDICLKDSDGEDAPEGYQDIWTTLGGVGLMIYPEAAESEMRRIQSDFEKLYEEIL